MKRIPLLPGCAVRVTYLLDTESPYDHHTYLFSVTHSFAVLEVEEDYPLFVPLDWKDKAPYRIDKWRIENIEIVSRPPWYTDTLAADIMEVVKSNAK